jgi:hypothetical protein
MKKLSDFLVSYIIEDTPFNAPGTAIGMPGFGLPAMPSGTTGGSVGYNTGNQTPAYQPDYSYTDKRLGGMVKARQKDAQETLNRMRRVAARQAQGAGVDPGVESKIAELENQLSQSGYGRIEAEESEKLAQGRQRYKSGTQLSNLPSGMFKTTPKTAAEQEAYDAAKTAFTKQISGSPTLKGPTFSQEEIGKAFDVSREKSAAVDAERKAGSRISPVYQITQSDFKTATGRDYDPRNPQDRQVFFDLVSRGASTSSATAGPGEGPAYGSKEFYTMRQRPTNIPKFGTSGAWYDTETGQLARTTEQSRTRTAEKQAIEKSNKEFDEREKKLNAVTDFVVNFNYPNQSQQVSTVKSTPKPTSKQTLSPQDNFSFDVERGQGFIDPEDWTKLYGYGSGNPFIHANALGGEPTISLKPDDLPGIKPKANVAKSAKDYIDRVLLRKYRKPIKSEKQDLENFLAPEQMRQLFSGRGNLQGLDNFLTPEQQKQLFSRKTFK